MKKLKALICAILVFTLSVGVSALTVSAATAADEYSAAVNGIDTDADYAARLAYYQSLTDAYSRLSVEDAASVSDAYALMVAEGEAIAALGKQAEAFIATVGQLINCLTLVEKESVLNNAKAEGVYFSDESYTGITEALAQLASVEETIRICIAFIDAVDEVVLTDETDYLALRAALDAAKEYVNAIDRSYTGVSGAYDSYSSIASDLSIKERYTAEWIEQVEEMAGLTSYKYKKNAYSALLSATSSNDFIPQYPGVSDAELLFDAADAYFKDCIRAANTFILAVNNIDVGEGFGESILAAYAALDGVDKGVEGISSAESEFDEYVATYNGAVAAINAWMEG